MIAARRFLPLVILAGAALLGTACSAAEADAEIAADDSDISEVSYSSWKIASTLHIGETIDDHLAEPSARERQVRIVHPFFVGATADRPVTIHFEFASEDTPVQITLLAPLANGGRKVVRAEGQRAPTKTIAFDAELRESGTYLLAVSTHAFKTAGTVRVRTHAREGGELVDAVVSPKSGSLGKREIAVDLNPALDDQEIELWASAPPAAWKGERRKIASAASRDHKVTFRADESIAEGDDLWIVVPKKAAGTEIPLDDGTLVRLWTKDRGGIRFDRVGISDFGNVLSFTGVLPFFEGSARLSVYSASRTENGKPLSIGDASVHLDRPGQLGMGYSMFDADVALPLMIGPNEDQVNPKLPHENEVLAVGIVSEKPAFHAVGCFVFCNDLSGRSDCESREVECPAAVQGFDR